MKKCIWRAVVLVVFIWSVLCITANAAHSGGSCGTNTIWTLDDEGILIISGTGKVTSHPWDPLAVKRVVIEEGITQVGTEAFSDCMMESISLPNTLTRIVGYTFKDCKALKSISIPDNVVIEGYAFSGCSNMESVFLEDNVTICSKAFENCYGKKFATIGTNTALSLSDPNNNYLFYDPDYPDLALMQSDATHLVLKNATGNAFNYIIPDAVTSIANEAFSHCSNMTGIVIPEGITYIGESAFRCTKPNCDIPECNVRSVIFPRSITGMGNNAFSYGTVFYCYKDTYPYRLATQTGHYDCVLLDSGTDVIQPVLNIPESMDVLLGRDSVLGAAVFPYDQDTTVAFTCIDEDIATVSTGGIISPVSVGDTEITVRANGIEKRTRISVLNRAESFSFSKEIYVRIGESVQLTITDLMPENALTDLSWKLAYYGNASLNEKTGVLMGKSEGQAYLTVLDRNSGLWCNADVYIVPPVTEITFVRNTITAKARTTEQLQALVKMGNLSVFNQMITFESSDLSIATVDSTGLVTGIKPGTVVITASADGAEDTCEITFEPNVLRLPNSVTEIGEEAFANLDDVDTIVLPTAISKIHDMSFLNSDITLNIDSGRLDLINWAEKNNILFSVR